ncbi:type IV toxin-antitoxin system AbiEi family antitoxin domain-containing protein [Candidatus Sumerlaeota bacterium]
MPYQTSRIIDLARGHGLLRPRDLDPHGLPRTALQRLERKGLVRRVERGIYALADMANVTEFHSLSEVCKRVSHATICLLSALVFHGITTRAP